MSFHLQGDKVDGRRGVGRMSCILGVDAQSSSTGICCSPPNSPLGQVHAHVNMLQPFVHPVKPRGRMKNRSMLSGARVHLH
jgi:hypothetical protein